MTLREAITFGDELVPNAYSDTMKTAWLNECECMVQLDVFLLPEEKVFLHKCAEELPVAGLSFPDGATMRLPAPCGYAPGGTVTLSGLVTYEGNNSDTPRRILAVSEDGRALTFATDSFPETGEAGDSGTAAVGYDGGDVPMLAGAPFDKLYRLYLAALIHFANGEYDRYQNSMALFNSACGEYIRWYSRVKRPAESR